ncbi:MAG: hypothetical protein IJ457_01565 [Clostridia bacterium]|nr:hypothetical protein [Clostridia bacterium]
MKYLSLILALILSLSLFACGSSDGGNMTGESDAAYESSETSSENVETEKETEVETEIETEEETEEETESPSLPINKLASFKKDATIDETVLYSDNNVVITANELIYNNSSAEVKVTIENNSSENLSFSCGTAGYGCNSINGFVMYGGYLNCDVATGKKSKDTIKFQFDEMILNGIFEIADIEIGFRISNDDYDTVDYFQTHIYTSIYDDYEYDPLSYQNIIQLNETQKKYKYSLEYFSDSIVFDEADVTIESIALLKNKNNEFSLFIEVMNKSDSLINFNIADIYINNVLLSSGTFDGELISNGNRGIISMDFDSLLSETITQLLGIDEINSVSFTVNLRDLEYNDLAEKTTVDVTMNSNNNLPNIIGKEIYNQNNIKIAFLDLVESDSSYDDNLYAYFFVENGYGEAISLSDKYDSLSINGYMVDYYFMSGVDLFDGKYALMKLTLPDSSLEELDISMPSDITQIDFEFEIEDMEYNEIDTFSVSIDN